MLFDEFVKHILENKKEPEIKYAYIVTNKDSTFSIKIGKEYKKIWSKRVIAPNRLMAARKVFHATKNQFYNAGIAKFKFEQFFGNALIERRETIFN